MDNEQMVCDVTSKIVSRFDDSTQEKRPSSSFPHHDMYSNSDKRRDLTDTSMFLQTLNLKSKDVSGECRVTQNEADGIVVTGCTTDFGQPAMDNTFLDSSSSSLERYNFNSNNDDSAARHGQLSSEVPASYPNFLTDANLGTPSVYPAESESCHESENQNSLGKTLATSLHLIAAADAHTLPTPVEESPLPDSVGIDELPLSNREPLGPNSNDSVTSTTPENDNSTPSSSRYRTRSKAGYEKTASFKEDTQSQSDSDLEAKEERISSTEDEPFYRCDTCGKGFHKKQTLRQHFITHTDRFACAFCNVRCKSKGDLRLHTQTHTKEKPFHCDVCDTHYTRESILKKHKTTQLHKSACLKAEQPRSFLKGQDNKPSTSNLRSKASELKKTKCGPCDKTFSSQKKLLKHSRTHEGTLKCPKCHLRCRSFALLKVHERCHSKMSTLSCKICSRSFSSIMVLKQHIRDHYKQPNKVPLMSAQYSKPMRNTDTDSVPETDVLVIKKRPSCGPGKKAKKEPEILYCQMCPRRFKSPKAFEKHCAKHTKPPEQVIKEDEKDSGNPLEVKVDQGDGNMNVCDECSTSFDTIEELKTHRTDVHNLQSVVCHICYCVFKDSSDFKDHVQNHTPTMLFSGGSLEDTKVTLTSKKATKRCTSNRSCRPTSFDNELKIPSCPPKAVTPSDSKIEIKDEVEPEVTFHCSEFVRLVKTTMCLSSDEEGTDGDVEDEESNDEQLYRGLQNLLCYESHDTSEVHAHSLPKPPNKDITPGIDYESFLDNHVVQDYDNNLHKCIPCNTDFMESGQLINHITWHACETCEEYFVDEKTLLEHKSSHESNQKKEKSCRSYESAHLDVASSSSEDESNDLFLDELESVLDCETKTAPQIDFLHTFSHDEIVKANKKVFERYSCIDVPTNIYACTICKRKYARPTTLTRHFKTHVCHYCNKFFIDKSDLLEHKYKHRQKAAMLKAEISGEQSTKLLNSPLVSKVNRELFKKFTFIDSSRNVNKCCLCDKAFVRKTVLTRHMKTHICSYCDKFYEDKYELARHVEMHKIDARVSDEGGEARDYNDFDDEKPFSSRPALTDQIETDDGKMVALGPSFPSSLPHFSSTFANPGGGAHETLTFIEIPVSDNCGESTNNVTFGDSNEAVTSTYQIISDSIDAFKESAHESFMVDGSGCQANDPNKIITIAPRQMMAASDANRELAIAPRERLNLFECNLCGKSFFKSGHLKSHMSTHTVRKPHVCHLCGKSFVRRGALKRHEKSHDIKRCKFCDTSFNYQFELDDHMQMHEPYPFYK